MIVRLSIEAALDQNCFPGGDSNTNRKFSVKLQRFYYLQPILITTYIIVEGNYLLLDQEDWRDLSQFWGYSVFVEANFDELERRLINRWLDHGLDRAAAKKRAHDNDIVNAATVLNHRMPSDLTLNN